MPSLPPYYTCEAEVLPGLEAVATHELTALGAFELQQQTGAIRFSYQADLDALLDLRSVTAVYLLSSFAIQRPKALLGNQQFALLLSQIDQVRRLWTPRSFASLRLSAAGEDSAVLTRLKQQLGEQTGLPLADEADLLVRLRRAPGGWDVLVRLSPRPLATRAWRVSNLPGALNATLAHAMARLTAPQPTDRVLNLCCGSATLLIERLALAPARQALGCDTDPTALAAADANLVAAGLRKQVQLEGYDARQLPLAAASFDMICADLPFGQLVGSHQQNQQIYPQIIAEATRVAAPGARMALVTHEVRLLEAALAQHQAAWQLTDCIRVQVSGIHPRVFVLRRLQP